MTGNSDASLPGWEDENTPEWTDDQIGRAELAVTGAVVRAARGTLTRADGHRGVVRERGR